MKIDGFKFAEITLIQALKKYNLPEELKLWGDFRNFVKLNYDHRPIKVLTTTYFEKLVATIVIFEGKKYKILPFASSPHTNLETPFGHIYLEEQKSQRDKEQLWAFLVENLDQYIKKRYLYFSLILPAQLTDIREFQRKNWQSKIHFTYLLDLEKIRQETVNKYVGKKVRNLVKYADLALEIKKISATEFYSCYTDTYARQNKKSPHPLIFFDRLSKLKNSIFWGVFDKKSQSLAGGIIFIEVGSKAYYLTSGIKQEFFNSNAITLLIYKYLENLVDKPEIKTFDLFGAGSPQVAYFKSIFNPQLQPFFEVKTGLLAKIT